MLIILAGSAFGITLTDCKDSGWINGETYTLVGDVFTTKSCMVIDTDNIVLDCNGMTIEGDGSGVDAGVKLSNHQGITVVNCRIDNFEDCIDMHETIGNTIEGNTLSNCLDDGMDLDKNANSNIIKNNRISKSAHAIMLTDAKGNRILDNTINDVVCRASDPEQRFTAIGLLRSSSNTVSGNKISGSECSKSAGISSVDSYENTYTNNEVRNFLGVGFGFINSNNNILDSNIAEKNMVQGMLFVSSEENEIKNTKACNNGLVGIVAPENNYFENNICDNVDDVACHLPCEETEQQDESGREGYEMQLYSDDILGKIIKEYHKNMDKIPSFIKSLAGTNNFHVHFQRNNGQVLNYAVVTQDAVIIDYRPWVDEDNNNNHDDWDRSGKVATMEVWTNEKAVEYIIKSPNPVEALMDSIGSGIYYEALTFGGKVKKAIATIGISILGLFI